jgi:hypothetical protein
MVILYNCYTMQNSTHSVHKRLLKVWRACLLHLWPSCYVSSPPLSEANCQPFPPPGGPGRPPSPPSVTLPVSCSSWVHPFMLKNLPPRFFLTRPPYKHRLAVYCDEETGLGRTICHGQIQPTSPPAVPCWISLALQLSRGVQL